MTEGDGVPRETERSESKMGEWRVKGRDCHSRFLLPWLVPFITRITPLHFPDTARDSKKKPRLLHGQSFF